MKTHAVKTYNRPKWLTNPKFLEFRIYYKMGKIMRYYTCYGTLERQFRLKMTREEQIEDSLREPLKVFA